MKLEKSEEVGNKNFKKIVSIFYNEEISKIGIDEKIREKIKIEPKIIYDKLKEAIKIEFKIGNKKMYKINNLGEFYTRMLEKNFYKYAEKLEFIHTEESFEEESKKLLKFMLKYAEIMQYSNANSNYTYYEKAINKSSIIIGNSGIDELFEILEGKKIKMQKDCKTEEIEFTNEQPKIEFKLKKINDEKYKIIPNIEIFKVTIIKGKNYKYILGAKKLYRCNKEFENTNLKLLEIFRQNYIRELTLKKEDLPKLFSIVMPKVKNAIVIENIENEELEKYKPKDLGVEVYLDFDENDYLIAQVKFVYGEKEFNPLDEKIKLNFPRNIIQETQSLNIFRKTGFMFDKKHLRFILPDDDKIYEFLTEDINNYMQKFEVLVTEKFKTKQIREPKIGNIAIKLENNLLEVDLGDMTINKEELEEIMSKYNIKKKYYRLKDGSFVKLEENKEIGFINNLISGTNITYKDLEKGQIKLPANRSLYLNRLLKNVKGIEITKNEEYRNIVTKLDTQNLEDDIQIPKNLDKVLRYYQKTGFKWLKILDSYKFGGILADDMGLRKNNSNVICDSYRCQKRKNSKFSCIT